MYVESINEFRAGVQQGLFAYVVGSAVLPAALALVLASGSSSSSTRVEMAGCSWG